MNEEKKNIKKQQNQENMSQETSTHSINESNVGYPDITKANTKFVVIASLIVLLLILLLSIFIPAKPSSEEGTTTSTETSSLSNTFIYC